MRDSFPATMQSIDPLIQPYLAALRSPNHTVEMGSSSTDLSRCKLAVEGRATADLSPLQAALKPFGALSAGAVGPRLGADGAAAHLLQMIVANRGGGFQCSGDIVFVDDVALFG